PRAQAESPSPAIAKVHNCWRKFRLCIFLLNCCSSVRESTEQCRQKFPKASEREKLPRRRTQRLDLCGNALREVEDIVRIVSFLHLYQALEVGAIIGLLPILQGWIDEILIGLVGDVRLHRVKELPDPMEVRFDHFV